LDFWERIVGTWCDGSDHLRLVFDRGTTRSTYTGKELMVTIPRVAARLRKQVGENRLVFIISDDPEEQWLIFLGALWLGLCPGILAPPTPKIDPELFAEEFEVMVNSHPHAKFAISRPVYQRIDGKIQDVRLIHINELFIDNNIPLAPRSRAQDLTFYQQSSGTTGLRKGMIVPIQALTRQLTLYGAAIEIRPDDVIVSWLPLYHDMGLIAGAFNALYHGLPFICASPFLWLGGPRWLFDAIYRYQGTLCWMPNFAFEFMVQRARASWNMPSDALSSVRMIVNCSEVTSSESMARFQSHFQSMGLEKTTLAASYAMAETVFALTQTRPGASLKAYWIRVDGLTGPVQEVDPGHGRSIASSGRPLPDVTISIAGHSAPPDLVAGPISASSPCLLSEYVTGSGTRPIGRGGLYETGDYGFMVDGELYVLGRTDDMINRAGAMIDPSMVEDAALTARGVKSGRVVAFGLRKNSTGTEDIVVLAEPDEDDVDTPMLTLRLVEAIGQRTGISPSRVEIVPRGWLVKSTSGKMSRMKNRRKFEKESMECNVGPDA
jgi:fatty-acyl-CoA synthase